VDRSVADLDALVCIAEEHHALHHCHEQPHLSPEQQRDYDAATVCHICKNLDHDGFDNNEDAPADAGAAGGNGKWTKVRDHDHYEARHNYRGAAHDKCNREYHAMHGQRFTVPVFYHNLKGYDVQHLLFHSRRAFERRTPKIVALNAEKILAVDLGRLRFRDSCQHLQASLDDATRKRPTPLHDARLRRWLDDRGVVDPNERAQALRLMQGKGLLPYEHITDVDCLRETRPLPREAFDNRLRNERLSVDEYVRYRKVYRMFRCRDLADYRELYLIKDVYLQADAMEAQRSVALQEFGLDPAHYFGAPALALDAALKVARDAALGHGEAVRGHSAQPNATLTDPSRPAGLQLFRDDQRDMLEFVERSKRGGITHAASRYAEANNRHMGPDHDPSKQSVYLSYLDVTNLYGLAMSKHLPVGGFRWDDDVAAYTPERLAAWADDAPTGAFLELAVRYPEHLHDVLDSYPPCPVVRPVDPAWMSDVQRAWFGDKPDATNKLLLTLHDKDDFVCHFAYAKRLLSVGLDVTVKRVLLFDQCPFFKPYVDLCTNLRRNAENPAVAALAKLLINSLYGKTIEDPRNHSKSRLLNVPRDNGVGSDTPLTDRAAFRRAKVAYLKAIADPDYRPRSLAQERIRSGLHQLQFALGDVDMNKPFYVGLAVLDISKAHMLDFHYGVMLKKYGHERCRCVYTDTDSFVHRVETDDFFHDLATDPDLAAWFDPSSWKNAPHLAQHVRMDRLKVPGYFTDELEGNVMTRFVCLRPKMYALETLDLCSGRRCVGEKRRAKGVPRHVAEKTLGFDAYLRALRDDAPLRLTEDVVSIASKGHQLVTRVQSNRMALGVSEAKRFYLDSCTSLAYGHVRCSAAPLCNSLCDNVTA
jgi:hypothetical protein